MNFVCLTPEALEALRDPQAEVSEHRLREAPSGVGVRPEVAPPPDAKAVYGGTYANHFETANFTINWEDGQATPAEAARAAEALEASWTYFVDEQGWAPPVSSDRYYVWVILVNDLGATGFTTEYYTSEYPQGYPVIYLNSTWAYDEAFWRSLAVHEFHHGLQYAARELGSGSEESWYWEASASWASLLVEPDSAALDYTVPWYSDQSTLSYDSATGSHAYGMMVFNAWLDLAGVGAGTMQRIWAEGGAQPGASWRGIIEDATGRSAGDLWASFASDFGNDTYGRTATWADPPITELTAGESVHGSADELGSAYYAADTDVWIDPHWVAGEGSLDVRFPGQAGAAPWLVPAGTVVAVTTTEGPLSVWSIVVRDGPFGDTGSDVDTGDTGDFGDSSAPDGVHPSDADSPSCGCAVPSPARWPAGAVTGFAALWLARRAKPGASR